MSEHTHDKAIRMYALVFIALLVLLVVTVAVAAFDFGALNLPIAIAIAGIKAALVLTFFMHLNLASNLTRLFALAAFLWLALLIVLALSDYVTRGWAL